MSWLSRITPRGAEGRNSRSVAPSSPCTADPETCLMVFENHWRQVSWVLEQRDCVAGGADDLTAVRNHTDQMLCLLAEERPAGGDGDPQDVGPILKLVASENILERLVQWHVRRGLDPDSQTALLKLFEMLIGQSQQPLLQHSAVLQPLLILLGACVDPQLGCPPNLEASLVLLLNQVCVSMARQPAVLELLFRCGAVQQGPTNLLIFSLLVPFIHRDGVLGQQARDALLLVMATSASNHAVARYITENSYFCPVLATGLSALYSSLPRKIEVRGDDWHSLRREDWMGVSSLVLFMNSLEFCNAVVQVAHPLVRCQLLDYLHNGFLVPVMGPALHKSSVDEMIASTAYLDLFLRSITEKSLLKTFLRFILLHRHDNDTILDTLLTRISSNSRLCMVSLSLFKTLLSLNCEDLMLQLVLRYLLPCTHVMLSQRRAVRETDLYGKSADKFLSLIPECCRIAAAAGGEKEEEPAFWGKVLGSPTSESPVHPKPSTPSRSFTLFIRQQNAGTPSFPAASENTPSSPRGSVSTPSSNSPMHQTPDASEAESGYLEYLRDARRGIELCSWACRDWSAPYDGENPSPNSAPPPPPPPTSNPSLSMVPEHFSMQPSGFREPQQRAAVVAAARAEWSSSDRNSGEWDVTITKNCISLTPRSKKRSLLPSSVPLQPSSSSPSSPKMALIGPAEPAGPHPHTGSHRALYNGTGQTDECVDTSVEVKKVKRDAGVGESGLNGSVCAHSADSHLAMQAEYQLVTKPSQVQSTELPQPQASPPNLESSLECNSSEAQRSTPALSSNEASITTSSQALESVESLIEELLEQAPSETPSGESNGQGISIEAFHQELRELEERVKAKRVYTRGFEEFIEEPSSHSPGPNRPDEESSSLEAEQGAGESKPDLSTPTTFSPARPLGQPLGQPYIGPFLTVLFSKLENMMQNSLYVNILLTGIVFQLACYPQPLLRSFLLNTNMVFQPSVKSLIQVLGSVKNRIEAFAAVHEDFPAMLRKARRFLVTRGKLDWTDSPAGVPPLRRSESMVKSRKPSLGELILRHTNSPTRARHAAQAALAHVRDGGHSLHSALFRGVVAGTGASSLEKQAEALRVKNTVYCAVIFSEFLKELAALAQEHAVAMPFPPSQDTEE